MGPYGAPAGWVLPAAWAGPERRTGLDADQVVRPAGGRGQGPHLGDAPPGARRQWHPEREVGEGEVGQQLPVGDQPSGVVDLRRAGRRTTGEAFGEAAHGAPEPRVRSA